VAELVVDNAFCYLGAHDFTGDIKQWSMDGGSEVKDKTTFRNNGARKYRMGLFTTVMSMSGFADLSEDGQDVHLFTPYAARSSRVVTVGNVETEGQPCCMTQQLKAAFNPGGGGPVGELSAFAMTGAAADGVPGIRGVLLKEQGSVSATGAIGTGVQLGAASATQYLYSTLHLLGTAGTSVTVVVESDDNAGFSSATTRGTFGPLTAVGGNWLTPVIGPFTDSYWRLRASAITGTWTIAGAVGIQ